MFITGLSSLLNKLEMSEDLFSFGPTSRLIANKLASLEQSHERRKVSPSDLIYNLLFSITQWYVQL